MESTTTTNKAGRLIKTEWKLDDTHYAVLSVGHSKESKTFYATLRQEEEEICAGYTSRSFMLFDGVTVARVRIARYSFKELEKFAALAMATVLQERALGNDKVVAKFTVEAEEEVTA